MSDFTDDDVAALARKLCVDGNDPCEYHRNLADLGLAVVAPAIAARTLREAADAMQNEKGVTFADALMIRWLLERAEQVSEDSEGVLDSMALSSYAGAMRLLAEHGRITITDEYGRRVLGRARAEAPKVESVTVPECSPEGSNDE